MRDTAAGHSWPSIDGEYYTPTLRLARVSATHKRDQTVAGPPQSPTRSFEGSGSQTDPQRLTKRESERASERASEREPIRNDIPQRDKRRMRRRRRPACSHSVRCSCKCKEDKAILEGRRNVTKTEKSKRHSRIVSLSSSSLLFCLIFFPFLLSPA